MKTIEIYLRSNILPGNLDKFKDSYDLHYYFELGARDTYTWLFDQGFMKGRIFEEDSAALLPLIDQVIKAGQWDVKVYDLGSLRGAVKAWLAGLRRAPGVVIDGQKHVGLAGSQAILRQVIELSH